MKGKVVVGLIALGLLAWVVSPKLDFNAPQAPRETLEAGPNRVQPQVAGILPAAASTGLSTIPVKELPMAPRDVRWSQPAAEPVFATFADWTRRYLDAASPTEKAALEAEGVTLARARLTALANLIVTRPERALELAAPDVVRQAVPDAVKALLEETVNTRTDYEVVCVMPLDRQEGESQHDHEVAPFIRSAKVNGETHRVFTFGSARDYVTRTGVPINGVSVPATATTAVLDDPIRLKPSRLLALSPSPGRLLDQSELATKAPGSPVAVEWGGEVRVFATMALAENWAASEIEAASLDQPQLPPTAESSYTEGRKRFLLMRVDFPDYTVDVFPTNNALSHMRDMSNFLAEISYYKHVIAPVGQGSDITPIMRMTNNASTYDNAGLSVLYPEARAAAQNVYGYDLSKYDFFFVCTGGKPAYGYAGLGYVGGVGYHLANSYFDVRTSAHEFGHNLGLGHANWWNTSGRSTIGAGSGDEYGDSFDTMGGSGGGVRHFSASFKNRLGWIPNDDAITVTASGVYRLHAHDLAAAPVGLRALRLNRASGDPYWIEFRQLWTGNKALMNGINFRWAGGNSQLLDMRPGSSAGKDDHPLTIGSTFSDPTLNYHVTPLRKANTYPESIDVAINLGPFPANQPPTAIASASTLAASPGQTISFSVTASDPNGDSLAYAWDFGDGDYSVDNSAGVTHSFGSVGEYYVEVAVSDMKGGVARDSVIVTVGSPTTYSIGGRVLDRRGLGVTGVKVSVSSTAYAYTESDGTYTLTRLSAGSYTVSAVDPVADAYYFLRPFFTNPVTVGPDFVTADFIVTTNSANLYTPIFARESNWKYLDDGSDQGTVWTGVAFDDSGWSNGTAVLGYGEGNENTEIRYGTDPANKHVTYYFRKAFTISNPAAYTNLQLEVLRDDGVIVYLNGTEVYRNNMPAGAVTYTTLASDSVEPDAYLQTTLGTSALVAGTNVIAAEIHQGAVDSSDVNFDCALSGLAVSNLTGLTLVYVSQPAADASFTSPTNIIISAFAKSGAAPVSLVEFYADGIKIGEDAATPFAFVWSGPADGSHILRAVASIGSGFVTSAPVAIKVSAPGTGTEPVLLSLIPLGSAWKYLAGASAVPGTWASPSFSDASWLSGAAQLGFGDGDETTVIDGGPSAHRYATIYFRRAFEVNDPGAITSLALRLRRDDGAVVYLNGVEIARDNMPPGAPTYSTLATNAADDGNTFFSFALAPSILQIGSNVMAVEVHQSALDSSDLSFDLALDALASTNRPRGIWLTSPTNGNTLPLPGSLMLRADVVAGSNLGVAKVEYYAAGAKVGEALAWPFESIWREPPPAIYQIVAVATDSAGTSLTSAPVNVMVSAPRPSTAYVSLGDVWKYLDDGSNQGTNWIATAYDDRAWQAGAARLGYGGDGETTTVSYGPNAASRYVTTYFRRSFTLGNSAGFSGLLLRVVRDDGAVVYLNGREIFRNNLPSGLVAFNTLATNTVSSADETTPLDVTLPITGLVAGTNVLAVEVHQAAITSSDLGFDLALHGLRSTNMAQGIYLTSPANSAHFNAPANVPLSAFVKSASEVTLVEYFDGATKIGQALASPFHVTWNAPVGVHTLTGRATLAGGSTLTSPAIVITVGNPPPPIEPVVAALVSAGSDWKYWDNVTAVGTGWQQPGFDDSAWPSGVARFGWGWDGERTLLTEGRVTHYFRKWFAVPYPASLTELLFQLARDDGAVVYLNGVEVFRSNMPGGTVTESTLASSSANTPDETTYFEATVSAFGAGLTAGTNLVAVELHQGSATSSDAGFDLQLTGYGTTEPRVTIGTPANNAVFQSTNAIVIEAFAQARAGITVSRVEFFTDGVKLGETTASPYRFTWATPSRGVHVLVARLTDSAGGVLESAPVQINVARESVSSVVIPIYSVWRYLDNGTDQGTNWSQPNYNDNTWKSGAARLGYGGDGEATTVSYGSSSGTKYITTYFRRAFVAPTGVVFTNLYFRLVRDDGAVVWLNGHEVFRSNMPDGPVAYTTRASAAVSGSDEQTFFPISALATHLVPGTNVLAVEIHQNDPTSSDLGFNLELTITGYVEDTFVPTLQVALVDGLLELSWPEIAVGWRVYAAPDLATPAANWTPLTDPPVVVGGRRFIVVQPSAGAQYFRLGKP